MVVSREGWGESQVGEGGEQGETMLVSMELR